MNPAFQVRYLTAGSNVKYAFDDVLIDVNRWVEENFTGEARLKIIRANNVIFREVYADVQFRVRVNVQNRFK